jgi:RNA polymerase sigma factor (TIGR02999 family)
MRNFFDRRLYETQNGHIVPEAESRNLTELLQAWSEGDVQALEKLAPRVQQQLHRLARRLMAGERPNHPLQATALINEAYIRLIGWKGVRWQNRAHFFAISAQFMRRILVDAARARGGVKRGAAETTLDEGCVLTPERPHDLVLLDDALTKLATLDPRKSRIVELRFFGGLNAEETAAVLQISLRTVEREWRLAKAWLYREIRSE